MTRAFFIIVMPFILVYLLGVMIALRWNPMAWPDWVFYGCTGLEILIGLFWVLVYLIHRDFRNTE
jgi:hypothetical protein